MFTLPTIQYTLRKLTLLFAVCIFTSAKGQINLFYNNYKIPLKPQVLSYYIDTSFERDIDKFTNINNSFKPVALNNINLSYKNQMLWLRINLNSIENANELSYLILRSPHINFLNCWILQGDTVVKKFTQTGDHFVFGSRTITNANFVYPIIQPLQPNTSLLLLIDKRNEQLNIPIHLFTENGYNKFNQQNDFLAGVICGIAILLFALNLFLYVKMKERLYVFYGFYIFMTFLYIVSDYGLAFMYLFPNFPQLCDFTRPITISFLAPLYLVFTIQFLKTKTQLPLIYKWIKYYFIFYILFAIVIYYLMTKMGTLRATLIWVMQILITFFSIISLIISLASMYKKIQYSNYLFFSCLVFSGSFLAYSFFFNGAMIDNLFTRNLLNIGFIVEITILAFVLTLRFKNYKENNEALLQQINTQQTQIFNSLSSFHEKERLRISSLLHDTVGASLSAVRLNLEANKEFKNNQAIEQISNLANEVRQLSHSLSPILLQKKGLITSLTENIENLNESNKIQIQFENIGSLQKILFRYEMLVYTIIQELLQNILKHAQASEVIIQLMLEEKLVSIFVEDNGKGFDEKLIKEGLGFAQIKELVKFVNGTIQIKSIPQNGCQISIEFPIISNESTSTDIYS